MRAVPNGRTEAQSLEARSLEVQSLESRSLESRSLEAQSLESRSLEARSLRSQNQSAKGGETPPLQQLAQVGAGFPRPLLEDRPLTVIHVGPSLVRGGAEQWLVDLVRFLDPKKIRVLRTIATEADLADPNFTSDLPIPVEIGQADSVRRAARECDVLVSWGLGLNDWLKDCRPPLSVVLAHGDGPYTRDALIGSAQVIDHVIAVSQAAKDICGAELPTSVIHNGVDCSRLGRTRSREAVRTSLGFQPGDFVMGTIGRYSPEKRLPALVEATALLPSHFKLLLVGWGAQRTALLEQANARIPSRFALASGWSYLGDYYSAMDAFCMASESEGGPLVVIEAMHCGRPVVATPVGFVPEIIKDRINGVIVDGSPMSFAAAVMQLARHPEWARGMAAEGKAYAEQNSHARRMALDYEELLQRLWREKYAT